MQTKIEIAGEYSKKGDQLSNGEITLHIGKRKNPTDKKPSYFLRQIKPEFDYISSMYPTALGSKYQIDYAGQKYIVWVRDTTAQIEKI